MDLDAGLLQRDKNNEEKSEQKSGDFRNAQRSSDENINSEGMSLRQTVIAAKREREIRESQEEKNQGSSVMTPVRQGTSRLLRQAWLHLVDSFGLTFIWINIHAILHVVFGDKIFCKLGHEWADMSSSALKDNPGLEAAKKRASSVESMGVGLIDFLIFLVILGISFVAYIVAHPYDVGLNILGDLLKEAGVSWLS